MLDARYWILDAGYWMLDTGNWILDVRTGNIQLIDRGVGFFWSVYFLRVFS
jgi:hypothetical protein